jgi:hypothetical protein
MMILFAKDSFKSEYLILTIATHLVATQGDERGLSIVYVLELQVLALHLFAAQPGPTASPSVCMPCSARPASSTTRHSYEIATNFVELQLKAKAMVFCAAARIRVVCRAIGHVGDRHMFAQLRRQRLVAV